MLPHLGVTVPSYNLKDNKVTQDNFHTLIWIGKYVPFQQAGKREFKNLRTMRKIMDRQLNKKPRKNIQLSLCLYT